jgi:hypothetical protein
MPAPRRRTFTRIELLWVLVVLALTPGGCAHTRHGAVGRPASQEAQSAAASPALPAITPEPQVQRLLDRLVHTPPRDPEFQQIVSDVRGAAGTPEGLTHLLRQAAYYGAHTPAHREDYYYDNDTYGPRNVLFTVRNALGIPWERVVAELVPTLSGRDDRLAEFCLEMAFGGGTPLDELDLKDRVVPILLDAVAERADSPDWAVAQLLYWRAPSSAVLGLADRARGLPAARREAIYDAVAQVVRVTGQPASLAGGPIIADHPRFPGGNHKIVYTPRDRSRRSAAAAVAQLDELSRFEQWWVKLYVAEMMRRYDRKPDLRDRKIVARLRKDPNPVIAKAAAVPFRDGTTRQGRMWWWPFEVEDGSEVKYLWRP